MHPRALCIHAHCTPTHCLQEYAALKQQLLDNTRKSAGAIGAYLLLTVNGTAALLAMLGAGASYAYLLWLCRDVDAVQPTDRVPIWEANKVLRAAPLGVLVAERGGVWGLRRLQVV
jgi:hypothetical protein